jgi:hypothetical protein
MTILLHVTSQSTDYRIFDCVIFDLPGQRIQSTIIIFFIFFLVSSLTKYLMDTIDFNKHDIDIFIYLEKIVSYGRHCRDESCRIFALIA